MRKEPELLNIKEAAQYLRVSETSLRRWTNAGRLACLRVGSRRRRRFRVSDLRAFMEDQPATLSSQSDSQSTGARHVVVGGIPMAYGTHLSAMYSTDAGRVQLAAGFLAGGLRPGTVCFLLAEPAAREAILDHLGLRGSALEAELRAGRLELGGYAASVQAQYDYWESRFLAAIAAGAESLRVVGDVGGIAKAVTPDEVLAYEAGYDRQLAQRFPVVTLCLYDARVFSSLDLLGILKIHQDEFRYPVERLFA